MDVGAQHPVIDSVTKAFYDRGWHGINVEPVAKYFHLLQEERPKDINLNLAVGNCQGKLTFYEVLNSGLSTVKKELADQHAAAGQLTSSYDVICTTLNDICDQYKVETVHFLKIDVEGAEKSILKGFDFRTRPWIIVIEANEPNTQVDASWEWEKLILNNGYIHVYYDGTNRFYLTREHAELKKYFDAPPNHFDQYVSYRDIMAQEELATEKREKEQLVHRSQELQQELVSEKQKKEQLSHEFQEMQQELVDEKQERERLRCESQGLQQELINRQQEKDHLN
jgi:FkbM family methyltransferase